MHALRFCALGLILLACAPAAESGGGAISATELAERIAAGTAPVILDVRSPDEFAAGHLPGARNVPHDELRARIGALGLSHDQELVVHCHSGRRADIAREELAALGFRHVRELEGHWQGWQASGGQSVEAGG
jgi:rhodanese-related sulfurtransferase